MKCKNLSTQAASPDPAFVDMNFNSTDSKNYTICRQSPSYITKPKLRNVITTLACLTVSIKQDFRHQY